MHFRLHLCHAPAMRLPCTKSIANRNVHKPLLLATASHFINVQKSLLFAASHVITASKNPSKVPLLTQTMHPPCARHARHSFLRHHANFWTCLDRSENLGFKNGTRYRWNYFLPCTVRAGRMVFIELALGTIAIRQERLGIMIHSISRDRMPEFFFRGLF